MTQLFTSCRDRDCEYIPCNLDLIDISNRYASRKDGTKMGQVLSPTNKTLIEFSPIQISHWREAYFEFRDEIENCLLSVSCLETRMRFCPPNLEPRDEIENFVHRISGLETRLRSLFLKSRNSRRDRDFSIILPKHISKSEKKMFPINAQTLQCN